MKKVFWILTSILALALSACGSSATPTAIPTVSLDSASQPSSSTGNATASAIVVPVKKVELAFPLSGAVKTVEVEAGDSVKAGDQPSSRLKRQFSKRKSRKRKRMSLLKRHKLHILVRTGTSQENLDAAKADVERMQSRSGDCQRHNSRKPHSLRRLMAPLHLLIFHLQNLPTRSDRDRNGRPDHTSKLKPLT